MRAWEKRLKAARDTVRRRPDVTRSFTPVSFCKARRKSASRLARTRSVALVKMRLPTRPRRQFHRAWLIASTEPYDVLDRVAAALLPQDKGRACKLSGGNPRASSSLGSRST